MGPRASRSRRPGSPWPRRFSKSGQDEEGRQVVKPACEGGECGCYPNTPTNAMSRVRRPVSVVAAANGSANQAGRGWLFTRASSNETAPPCSGSEDMRGQDCARTPLRPPRSTAEAAHHVGACVFSHACDGALTAPPGGSRQATSSSCSCPHLECLAAARQCPRSSRRLVLGSASLLVVAHLPAQGDNRSSVSEQSSGSRAKTVPLASTDQGRK